MYATSARTSTTPLRVLGTAESFAWQSARASSQRHGQLRAGRLFAAAHRPVPPQRGHPRRLIANNRLQLSSAGRSGTAPRRHHPKRGPAPRTRPLESTRMSRRAIINADILTPATPSTPWSSSQGRVGFRGHLLKPKYEILECCGAATAGFRQTTSSQATSVTIAAGEGSLASLQRRFTTVRRRQPRRGQRLRLRDLLNTTAPLRDLTRQRRRYQP